MGWLMVDKACLKCSWYDPVYVCTCPEKEPWQCPLNEEAGAKLDKAIEELNVDGKPKAT